MGEVELPARGGGGGLRELVTESVEMVDRGGVGHEAILGDAVTA